MAGGYFRISTENTKRKQIIIDEETTDVLIFDTPCIFKTFRNGDETTTVPIEKAILLDAGVAIPCLYSEDNKTYWVKNNFPYVCNASSNTVDSIRVDNVHGVDRFTVYDENGNIISLSTLDPSIRGISFSIEYIDGMACLFGEFSSI